MLKKNRNMHSSFTWQRKHLFMLSREVEGELGEGGGRGVEYRIPAFICHENPTSRTFVVAISRISFFGFLSFFLIVNYEVITNGY